jgi:hypothetical protein
VRNISEKTIVLCGLIGFAIWLLVVLPLLYGSPLSDRATHEFWLGVSIATTGLLVILPSGIFATIGVWKVGRAFLWRHRGRGSQIGPTNKKRSTEGTAAWASALAAVASAIAAFVTLIYLQRQEEVQKNQVEAAYEASIFQTQLEFLNRYLAASEKVFFDLAFVHGALMRNNLTDDMTKDFKADLAALQSEYRKSGILISQPLSIEAEALILRIEGRDLLIASRPWFEPKSSTFLCDAGYYQQIYSEMSTCIRDVLGHFRPLSPVTIKEFCKPLVWVDRIAKSRQYGATAKEKQEEDDARKELKCPRNIDVWIN